MVKMLDKGMYVVSLDVKVLTMHKKQPVMFLQYCLVYLVHHLKLL